MVVGFSLSSFPLYLVQRGEILHFRMRVPKDIKEHLKMTEINISLKTSRLKKAEKKAQHLAWELSIFFKDIRRGKYRAMKELSKDEIRVLVNQWLKDNLDNDERERATTRKTGITLGDIERQSEVWSSLKQDSWEALTLSDHRRMKFHAQELLKEQNIDIPEDSDSFSILCREMLKAQIQALEVLQKRTLGDYSPIESKALFFPETQDNFSMVQPISLSHEEEKEVDKGPLLSVVLEEFVKDKLQLKEWTERTRQDNEPMVKDFIEMIGDMPIGELSSEHMRDARNRFLRIPKNRVKNPKYADKSLRELSDMNIPEKDKLSPCTLSNRSIKIGGFLNWARDRGYPVKEGLATVMKFKQPKRRQSQQRAVFTPKDLGKIFNPKSYLKAAKGDPARYWVPIISLVSGMRIEEICQLYLTDIREEKNILCFYINGKNDKHVKSLASERLVPLPPVLYQLNFLEYVENMRTRKEERLFPTLEKRGANGKYSDNISKWFNRYIEKIGVKDKKEEEKVGKKVFHSFRHTFANLCKQKQIKPRFIKQVIGHEQGKDITLDRYGKDYDIRIIYKELTIKVTPEVNLEPLVQAIKEQGGYNNYFSY
jgi:integrase